MKKLFILLTAVLLAAAVCGTALADPATLNGGVVGDNTGTALARSVQIDKTLKVFNPDTVTVNGPTITYSYAITGVAGGDSSGKTITDTYEVQAKTQTPPATMPTLTGTSGSTIQWTTADQLSASSAGVLSTKHLTIDFSAVSFTGHGVYRYELTETCSDASYTAAGVTNGTISGTRYLDVYVRDAQGTETEPQIYGYVLMTYDNNIDGRTSATANTPAQAVKTTGFVEATDADGSTKLTGDEYHTSNVTVSKTLQGDAAMNSHLFPFSVAFANTAVTADVMLKKQVGTSAATNMTAGPLGSTTDFQGIASGGSVKYIGIPAGTEVSAYETNDVAGTIYKSSATVTTGGTSAAQKSISWTGTPSAYAAYSEQAYNSNLASVTTTATDTNYTEPFVNVLELISPTGYVARYAPYALILAAGIALLLLAKKHKKHTDEE